MSKTINGVPFSCLIRVGETYIVKFDKNKVTLADIERIDWRHIEVVGSNVLPVGYGFVAQSITYASCESAYTVNLKLGRQYLGDVTAFTEQIAELEAAANEKDAEIKTLTSQMSEKEQALLAHEQTIAAKEQTIAENEQTISDLSAQLDEADETVISLYEQLSAQTAVEAEEGVNEDE